MFDSYTAAEAPENPEDTYLAEDRIKKPDKLYSMKEAKRELGL